MSDIFYIHFVILHLYMKHYSTKAICKSCEFSKKSTLNGGIQSQSP